MAAATVIELWHAPPSWLLPARRTDVHVLHWLHIHWLNAAALAALAATAGVVVQLFIWWQDRRRTEYTSGPQARDRDVMLRRVRRKWITDVLEPSLAHAARLVLGLQTRRDVLHIGGGIARRPSRQPELVPEEKTILEIFKEASDSMLILGAPGAGKTTLLLQLADALIDRAERDPDQPIPVVVNLESWATRHQALDRWLVDELWETYEVPPRTTKTWIAGGELVLLLDGLDEVAEHHRSACAAAINDYVRKHGLKGLVVCSRTQQLQQLAVRLQLEEALELQPPTDAQIGAFLDHLEMTGTPLTEVRAAIATDETLSELLSSPLMLNVITLAYHGREPTALAKHRPIQDRETMLWQAYVKRMFEQRPLPRHCPYTPVRATIWLRWLARALRDHNQAELHLDRLTAAWTPAPQTNRLELAGSWLVRTTASDIRPAEELHWSWKRVMSRLRLGAAAVLASATALGIAIWLLLRSLDRAVEEHPGAVEGAPGVLFWLVVVLATLLAVLLFLGPVLALGGGVTTRLRDERASPNQGIRRSARNGLIVGLATMLILGPLARLPARLAVILPNPPGGAPVTVIGMGPEVFIGLIAGLVAGLYYGGGACIQYWAVRAWLAYTGAAPLRYKSFLEAMAERLLVRRSGSSYQFLHRRLRDYLASYPATGETSDVTGTR